MSVQSYATGGVIEQSPVRGMMHFGEAVLTASIAWRRMSHSLKGLEVQMRGIRKRSAIIQRQIRRADVEFNRRPALIHKGRKP